MVQKSKLAQNQTTISFTLMDYSKDMEHFYNTEAKTATVQITWHGLLWMATSHVSLIWMSLDKRFGLKSELQ